MEEDITLTDRQKVVLRSVIKEYVHSGEPVGSKSVMENQQLTCSSATIRNEMAELESLGLLEQPHTSAGRVPTAAGYRYYVDKLVRKESEIVAELEEATVTLRQKVGELDQVLDEASRLASALTNYPGIAVRSRPGVVSISHFEGILVDENQFLLVMMFSRKTIRTKAVDTDGGLDTEGMNRIVFALNACLAGRSSDEINLPLMVGMQKMMGSFGALVSPLCKLVYDTLEEQKESNLRVEGVNRLLQYPEYADLEELRNMIALFEDKEDLLTVIRDEHFLTQVGTKVLIGSETSVKEMNNCSLIYRPVRVDGRVVGAIGVVGPRRMDYEKVITTIDRLADQVDSMLDGTPPSLPSSQNDPTKGPQL